MTRIAGALALLFIFCAAGHAQTSAPTPFDSFADKVYQTDWLARLSPVANELRERPDVRAVIVAYGVPNKLPGWPLRRANWARGVLTSENHGIAPSRVEVVFGGYRDEVRYEHWLLSPGEQLPVERFDFAAALTREKSAYKFDQFVLTEPVWGYDPSYSEYLDDRGRYEPLALALRHDPAARGFVVVYRSRKNPPGTDRRLAANIKRAILKAHAIAPGRVVAVGGGRRQARGVEIWIVPPGAPPPRPTPEVRPARRARG